MKTIFQKEDKVFDYQLGWGEVISSDGLNNVSVKFEWGEVSYNREGARFPSSKPTLSFTEYKLEGFSQDRPINYDDFIGKWGAFWSDDNDYRFVSKLNCIEDGVFQAKQGGWYRNFKPLSDEQIKILEL